MEELTDWLSQHRELLQAAGIASIVTFLGSLLALPFLIGVLPADYFVGRKAPPTRWRVEHPVGRLVVLTVKNLLGAVLLVMGVAMLVLPGQGLLTILAALVLLNFPGKRRLEIALVRRPRVFRALNWIRRRGKHPPLVEPCPEAWPR